MFFKLSNNKNFHLGQRASLKTFSTQKRVFLKAMSQSKTGGGNCNVFYRLDYSVRYLRERITWQWFGGTTWPSISEPNVSNQSMSHILCIYAIWSGSIYTATLRCNAFVGPLIALWATSRNCVSICFPLAKYFSRKQGYSALGKYLISTLKCP